MVARRLLIVLLVLLGVSTVAALLAPQRGDEEKPATTKPREPPAVAGSGEGALFKVTIDADSPRVEVVGAGDIPLRVGDQVVLRVLSRQPDQVEVPAFGLIEAVGRDAPAQFDLLLERPGTYVVKLIGPDRVVAKVQVTPAAPPG